MKNELLTKGIILPSGEIGKDKINLVAGAITQPFAEMVWVTTGGDMETINRLTNVLVTMNNPTDRGKLFKIIKLLYIRFHDLRHTAATNMHQLTGDFYTVGEVLGHTLAGIGVSLGLSMNFEAVTARYVDVRLERKKEVLDAYHGAVKQADPAKAKEAEPKKAKSAAKKKSSEIEL